MSFTEEKRDFERIHENTAVTLTYGNPPKESEGICRDKSESGVCLEMDSVIPLGSACNLTIHDGKKNKSKFQALIEIKRIQPLTNDRSLLGAIILETF
ncbi:PilZ domain-containing protein [Gammaproteobacteria bacterium]|nr:PilZ domain-containing protein [Gammaproteobacteria bacterium]